MSEPMHSATLRGIAAQLRILSVMRREMADEAFARAVAMSTPYLVAIETAHARANEAMSSSYLARSIEYGRMADAVESTQRPRRVAARAPKRTRGAVAA